MKKFLKRIALFAAFVLVFLAAGELVVRNIPDSYSYKNRYLTEHGDAVATLVLGSSHTYYGVRSDLLGDSVFNLANVSQTPDLDLALLHHYAGRLGNLRRVVLPVSYFTFVDPRLEETSEWFRCVRYKVGMHLPEHSDLSKYNFEISDFEGYTTKLRSLFGKGAKNRCDSLGWGLGFTVAQRAAGWEEDGKDRAKSTTLSLNGRADEVESIIGEIVAFCRERGVECVLVTTPVWRTCRENMDRRQYSDMKRRTERLTDKWHVRYFDMMADPDFTEEDFHDVDHLSDTGAAKFTAKLRKLMGG